MINTVDVLPSGTLSSERLSPLSAPCKTVKVGVLIRTIDIPHVTIRREAAVPPRPDTVGQLGSPGFPPGFPPGSLGWETTPACPAGDRRAVKLGTWPVRRAHSAQCRVHSAQGLKKTCQGCDSADVRVFVRC